MHVCRINMHSCMIHFLSLDSEALVSASMLASTAAGREERDVSIQSYDSEPKVDVMKRIEQLSNRYKEINAFVYGSVHI